MGLFLTWYEHFAKFELDIRIKLTDSQKRKKLQFFNFVKESVHTRQGGKQQLLGKDIFWRSYRR